MSSRFLFFPCRRVHISNKTLQYIGGEFEVEPAYGEKREDALRAAGLKTYFISKVLCPVSLGDRGSGERVKKVKEAGGKWQGSR